jgi:hypothetical protein
MHMPCCCLSLLPVSHVVDFRLLASHDAVLLVCPYLPAHVRGCLPANVPEPYSELGSVLQVLLLLGEHVARHLFKQPDDVSRLVGRFCALLAPGMWPLVRSCGPTAPVCAELTDTPWALVLLDCEHHHVVMMANMERAARCCCCIWSAHWSVIGGSARAIRSW